MSSGFENKVQTKIELTDSSTVWGTGKKYSFTITATMQKTVGGASVIKQFNIDWELKVPQCTDYFNADPRTFKFTSTLSTVGQ